MSKKRKTNHENYNYVVESIDKLNYSSKPTVISDIFTTEDDANEFKNDYCSKNDVCSKDSLSKIVVTRVPMTPL